MDEEIFWNLIARSRHGATDDVELQLQQLHQLLMALPCEEVLEFGATLWRLHRASYRADLWGAAYLINGGCSDDAFDYFRAWLIAQGQDVFQAALADPDSLASLAEEDETELEELLSLPTDVYEEQTGREDFYDRLPPSPRIDIPDADFELWSDGAGDMDPAKARHRYPKLFKKFGQDWE